MSNYTPTTDFSAKDALASGNPSKIIAGSEIDAEFSAIQTAISSKLDLINALSVNSSPDGEVDYVATYDASGSVYRKVLLNKLGPGINTAALLFGSTSQVISAATETRLSCINGQTFDLGSIAASSKITLTSSAQDGYYFCYARVVTAASAGQRRLGIGLYDSSNNLTSVEYNNTEGTASYARLFDVIRVVELTYSAGDYIGVYYWSENGETLPSNSATRLFAVRIA